MPKRIEAKAQPIVYISKFFDNEEVLEKAIENKEQCIFKLKNLS